MRTLVTYLLNHRKLVIWLFVLLALAGAACIPLVNINYDMAKYLPPGSASRQALDKLEQEFGYHGAAMLMAENISLHQALELKRELAAIPGISSVLWLDDVADLKQPLSHIDRDYLQLYYQDNAALYTLAFDEDDYSLLTGEALLQARGLAAEYNPALHGNAEQNRVMRASVNTELLNVMLVIIPLILLILTVISRSWFEPLLYIFVIGVAVLINMGTNLLFDSVSFIIFTMGAAIQMAVSIDYSLFLNHRFEEERAAGLDVKQAVIRATQKTFPAVAASAATTLAGFLALTFMTYGIGRDIGLVLAKGIAFSFIAVMLFLPPLLYSCHRLIEKTRHRALLRISPRLARHITRPRYLFLILAVLVCIPCYFAQLDTAFLYGDTSGSSGAGPVVEEKQRIDRYFDLTDQMLLLFPAGEIRAERALADDLLANAWVERVQGLVTLADPAIPRSMLPQALIDNFTGENYDRMIIEVNTIGESEDMFACVEFIQQTAARYYGGDHYLMGYPPSVADIRDSVQHDFRLVSLISISAVGLVILLSFRSLILPLLLVAVIQGAVYINMAIPYLLDQPLVFIGYLMVSSMQLGATIDYAILFTSRYMEARGSKPPRLAAADAAQNSGITVLTSGLILSAAGLSEAYISSMPAVSAIGMLIGRGALLSMCMVLLALPGLLTVFDKPIQWLTLRARFLPARQGRAMKED